MEEEVNKSLHNRLALLQDEVTAAQQEVHAAEEAKAEAQERVQVNHRVPLYGRCPKTPPPTPPHEYRYTANALNHHRRQPKVKRRQRRAWQAGSIAKMRGLKHVN